MFVDYILNGQGHGAVAEQMHGVRWDPGLLRPYLDEHGRKCCTVNTGRVEYNEQTQNWDPVLENVLVRDLVENYGVDCPVFNATSLRKEEWLHLDTVVLKAARQRLRAWADLAGSNTFGGFNGMAKMILLTHSGFWFSRRRLAVSRNSGTPLDTTMAEAAGRRVAEMIEQTTIGTETGVTYGGASTHVGGYGRTSKVEGYLTFTDRLQKTDLTTPTGSNPEATVQDFLEARDQLYDARYYGPYMVYHSTDWDQYLDNDYARLGGNNANMTLRDRLRRIEGIVDVRRLDFLTDDDNPFTFIFVQMTSDVARAVVGLDMTTVQWESVGGMRLDFKVMTISVPQLRSDFEGRTGILIAN